MLSACGTTLGVVVAFVGLALLRSIAVGAVPRLEQARIDTALIILDSGVAVIVAVRL